LHSVYSRVLSFLALKKFPPAPSGAHQLNGSVPPRIRTTISRKEKHVRVPWSWRKKIWAKLQRSGLRDLTTHEKTSLTESEIDEIDHDENSNATKLHTTSSSITMLKL